MHRPVPSLAWIGLMMLAGCQDYPFEEAPSAVVREKVHSQTIHSANQVDILFVMDNSRSMVGEQLALANSFSSFVAVLDERFGAGNYRIAVVTTGIESDACGPCPPDNPDVYSCTNITGENGRFQNRRGKMVGGTIDNPQFDFSEDDSCKVMDSTNLDCFFDPADQRGVALVGTNGCGYERGLEAMRAALSEPLISTWNRDFLREEASLAVVVVTDEEDCGREGDVYELDTNLTQRVCYYSAKGVGPDGSFSAPTGDPYRLEPVQEYYDFLLGLKGNKEGLVKFAAIVGVEDPADPLATEIRYVDTAFNSDYNPSCTTPGCTGVYCQSFPGTRYVELAAMFGLAEDENGLVDTICQADFSETLTKIAEFLPCPSGFNLTEEILDPALANVLVNDEVVPPFTCSREDTVEICDGQDDTGCAQGTCVKTLTYIPPTDPPAENARGGRIEFAAHFDPCELIEDGEIRIQLIYATP